MKNNKIYINQNQNVSIRRKEINKDSIKLNKKIKLEIISLKPLKIFAKRKLFINIKQVK